MKNFIMEFLSQKIKLFKLIISNSSQILINKFQMKEYLCSTEILTQTKAA
jgi:hypothetical protein